MIIREFQPKDGQAVQGLLGELGYTPDESEVRRRLAKVLETLGHRIIIADVDGEVAGLLHVFDRPALEKPCEAVVQALVVSGDHRGKGIGEALMREAEVWAERRNLSSVTLYSRVDRGRARVFYERIGYRVKATSNLFTRG